MARSINLAVKAGLLALCAFALVASDLPQFEGKGMAVRGLGYPISTLIVPAAWWLRGRRRPYPHAIDALAVAPFLLDTVGNVLGLFDTVDHFDDVLHAVNWALLVAAFGLAVRRLPIGRVNAGALAVGFGATTHILWELAEYAALALGYYRLDLTYTDTIGDLAVSLVGTVVGAGVALSLDRRSREEPA